MIVRICDKCKSKEVIDDLKKVDNVELKVECINFCGISISKYVAIINNRPVIAISKDEFIDKIKEEILK